MCSVIVICGMFVHYIQQYVCTLIGVSCKQNTKIYFLVHIIITVIYISTGLVGVVQCTVVL